MDQLDLFDFGVAEPTVAQVEARARQSDPQSSKDAAARMNQGKAKRHRERIVDLVWAHPGNTSKGLVAFTDARDKEDGIDRHEIARRLSEAEAAGEVYRMDGGKELTWLPGSKPK